MDNTDPMSNVMPDLFPDKEITMGGKPSRQVVVEFREEISAINFDYIVNKTLSGAVITLEDVRIWQNCLMQISHCERVV